NILQHGFIRFGKQGFELVDTEKPQVRLYLGGQVVKDGLGRIAADPQGVADIEKANAQKP
ncbi:MAG: hypothetical protein LBQ68_01140, partial [Clostridiales bacterium]|nr:hypothetical protein [Clostridiales bacterium]